MKKYENVVYFKCGCNDKVHKLPGGQHKEPKIMSNAFLKKKKCSLCGSVIKIQKKEMWTIKDKTITKEII